MLRPLRIALVLVGLAAAIYGTASLTGGWMGTPPWWERLNPRTEEFMRGLGRDLVRTGAITANERPWVSGGVLTVGLLVTMLAMWPSRRAGWRVAGEHLLRMVLFTIGLNALLYGTSGLTGQWLGRPLWSDQPRFPPRVGPRDPGTATGEPEGGSLASVLPMAPERRPGREWISAGVVAVGLGLGAWGAWPRRAISPPVGA